MAYKWILTPEFYAKALGLHTSQVVFDTAPGWQTKNTLLAFGDCGVESDTGLHKIGDGSRLWNSLEYGLQNFHHIAEDVTDDPDDELVVWDDTEQEYRKIKRSALVGGGTVEVRDEGTIVVPAATILNFIGIDVYAEIDGVNPDQANIFIPPPLFKPFYNTSNPQGNAVVNTITTYNRNVAEPVPENNFDIGAWVAGTVHGCLIQGLLNYTHTSECSFLDLTTTVEVTVYGADDVTPVDSFLTPVITGNIVLVSPSTELTVSITNWGPDGLQFQANIGVAIDIDTIEAQSGRFSIDVTHHNSGTDYTKLQGPMFYDSEALVAVLFGVTIAETAGFVITRFISGVEYYDLGSRFTIDIADIDYTNSDSYIADDLTQCDGTEYGLPGLTPGSLELTGWTVYWQQDNMSYNNDAWAITAVNFFAMTTTANVSARTLDWTNGPWVDSPDSAILIDTHALLSTRLIERFYDEQWRCSLSGFFDFPAQRSWVSSTHVTNSDAVFFNGGCERNVTDFTPYNPNPGSQPDYSTAGMASEIILIREFMHDGLASSGFNLNITGTYTTLEMKMAKAYDGTPTGGTVWVDMTAAYNFAQWNNGDPLAGTGCSTGGGHYTFGSNNIINTSDTMYMRIGFTAGQRITQLSVVFD